VRQQTKEYSSPIGRGLSKPHGWLSDIIITLWLCSRGASISLGRKENIGGQRGEEMTMAGLKKPQQAE